jgi:predicted metal-dependent hydrolase
MTDSRREAGLPVRRILFEFPDDIAPVWKADDPAWSHLLNGISFVLANVEPFTIEIVRREIEKIDDPELKAQARDFCMQEGQHYRHHRRLNEVLERNGHPELAEWNRRLKQDYAGYLERRSRPWKLAYNVGSESVACVVGAKFITERKKLFGGADPRVASFWLWHVVEEVEHKSVVHDVMKAVCPNYAYRVVGLYYAPLHFLFRGSQIARAMLRQEARWSWKYRLQLLRHVLELTSWMLPPLLRGLSPSFTPRQFEDPAWQRDWVKTFRRGVPGFPILDTDRLDAPLSALG